MRARVRRHLVLAYVVVAFAVSWAAWTPLLVRGARPSYLLVETAAPAGAASERGRPLGAGARPGPRNGAP